MYRRFSTGIRLHRFQAERIGDHCLPTTISDLQRRHGVIFARRTVKVCTRFGSEARVSEYWLEGEDLAKARAYFEPNQQEAA